MDLKGLGKIRKFQIFVNNIKNKQDKGKLRNKKINKY